jgi:hypothetical protein
MWYDLLDIEDRRAQTKRGHEGGMFSNLWAQWERLDVYLNAKREARANPNYEVAQRRHQAEN